MTKKDSLEMLEMIGRDTPEDEIESLRAQLANEKSAATEIYQALENSRAMLLATQAHAARLVEAMEKLLKANAFCEIARVTQFDQRQAAAKESVDATRNAQAALSTPINLDALHEDRARECERPIGLTHESEREDLTTWLIVEAAAHRAKKAGK